MSLERGICLPRQLAYLPCGEKVPGCVSAHPACEWWRNIDARKTDGFKRKKPCRMYREQWTLYARGSSCGGESPSPTHAYLPMCQRTKGNGGVKALPANLNENGTANGTVVTIAKWDLYQGKKNAKRNESGTKNEFLPITEKEEKNIYLELRFLNTEKVK